MHHYLSSRLIYLLISNHYQPRTYMTSLVSSKKSRQESFSLLQVYIQVGQDSRFKKNRVIVESRIWTRWHLHLPIGQVWHLVLVGS